MTVGEDGSDYLLWLSLSCLSKGKVLEFVIYQFEAHVRNEPSLPLLTRLVCSELYEVRPASPLSRYRLVVSLSEVLGCWFELTVILITGGTANSSPTLVTSPQTINIIIRFCGFCDFDLSSFSESRNFENFRKKKENWPSVNWCSIGVFNWITPQSYAVTSIIFNKRLFIGITLILKRGSPDTYYQFLWNSTWFLVLFFSEYWRGLS